LWWWYINITNHNSRNFPSSCLLIKTQRFGDWILSVFRWNLLRWAQYRASLCLHIADMTKSSWKLHINHELYFHKKLEKIGYWHLFVYDFLSFLLHFNNRFIYFTQSLCTVCTDLKATLSYTTMPDTDHVTGLRWKAK
jgi:hypothetical protein